MSVYTVHQPPARAGAAASGADRFVFVRDGFSFWAFFLSHLWMLWHRMWLVLFVYIVLGAAVTATLLLLGASPVALVFIGLLIRILIGLEAGTLRRFSLGLRGWTNLGIISGEDLEDAERRFYGSWLCAQPPRPAGLPPVPPGPPAAASAPPPIVGLFPEPGAQR